MSVPSSLGVPLLTIAIPTFNRADDVTRLLGCIERELESVTAGDVTVLVSDNASDDGTEAALTEQAQTRAWLRVHRQRENLGAVGNTAWLIENAPQSEYVWVFGDDDLLVPGSLASILGVLRAERPAWMFLPHAWVDDAGNRTASSPAPGAVERFGSPGELYQAYHQWLTFLSASITRTAALRESAARGNSENLYQPLLWYFGAALGGSCVVGPDVVVLAGMSVSLLGREHIVLTEHFTSMYDDGLHEGMTRAEFAATLDGLYQEPSYYDFWRRIPIERFAEIVARFPESKALRQYLFDAAREQSYSEAIAVLDAAAQAAGAKDQAMSLVGEGEALFAADDILGAVQRFNDAIAVMPTCTAAWNNLSVVFHHIGRGTQAVKAVETALFIAPDDADAQLNRDAILTAWA